MPGTSIQSLNDLLKPQPGQGAEGGKAAGLAALLSAGDGTTTQGGQAAGRPFANRLADAVSQLFQASTPVDTATHTANGPLPAQPAGADGLSGADARVTTLPGLPMDTLAIRAPLAGDLASGSATTETAIVADAATPIPASPTVPIDAAVRGTGPGAQASSAALAGASGHAGQQPAVHDARARLTPGGTPSSAIMPGVTADADVDSPDTMLTQRLERGDAAGGDTLIDDAVAMSGEMPVTAAVATSSLPTDSIAGNAAVSAAVSATAGTAATADDDAPAALATDSTRPAGTGRPGENGWLAGLASPASVLAQRTPQGLPTEAATPGDTSPIIAGDRAPAAVAGATGDLLPGRLLSRRLGDVAVRRDRGTPAADGLTGTRAPVGEVPGDAASAARTVAALGGNVSFPVDATRLTGTDGQGAATVSAGALSESSGETASDSDLASATLDSLSEGAGQSGERRPGVEGLSPAMTTSARPGDATAGGMFHSVAGGTLRAVTPGSEATGTPLAELAPQTLELQSPQASRSLSENLRWMVSEGVQVATVKVTPAGMGPVSVRIDVNDDVMNVSIAASQANTREALESLLPRLRESLGTTTQQTVQISVDSGSRDTGGGNANEYARQSSGNGAMGSSGDGGQGGAREQGAGTGSDRQAGSTMGGQRYGGDILATLPGGTLSTGGTGLFDEYI